jgi:iron complex transport system substrate-binding protein
MKLAIRPRKNVRRIMAKSNRITQIFSTHFALQNKFPTDVQSMVTFAHNMQTKIVSFLPAATEIICALGLEANLVGRSHECDFPESIKHLPVCTSANFPDNLSSLEIDKKVKQIIAEALSVYTIDRELIKKLAPDVIITQDQCEVCAVSLPEVEEALADYAGKHIDIISLQPNSLADIFNDINTIAKALKIEATANELIEDLEDRLNIIRHKLKFVENKPTVGCIEWLEPLMISGNWIPDLVTIAGGVPVLGKAGQHSPYVQWEDIRLQNPDVLILMPCGFPVERTLKEVGVLMDLPGFYQLQAVKNNRIYIVDGNQYFNRPGPRIVDSVEILAEIINPKQFIFGYEGEGWIKFSLV